MEKEEMSLRSTGVCMWVIGLCLRVHTHVHTHMHVRDTHTVISTNNPNTHAILKVSLSLSVSLVKSPFHDIRDTRIQVWLLNFTLECGVHSRTI